MDLGFNKPGEIVKLLCERLRKERVVVVGDRLVLEVSHLAPPSSSCVRRRARAPGSLASS